MITGSPTLSVWSKASPQPAGFDAFLEKYADRHVFYGSGKVALRDGLEPVAAEGDSVLLPAYIPDAVAEPILDLDLEPRFYAVERDLTPKVTDLRSRIDERTVAIVSVNYFGFPQPGADVLGSIAQEYDCYYVDDNAHSPLSVHEGTLLGTRGDLGITSLWKLLPIPNGALLYLNDPELGERYQPSAAAGINDRIAVSDCQFLLKSFVDGLLDRNAMIRHSVDTLVAGSGLGTVTASPQVRYENTKTKLSRLSWNVLSASDPAHIRSVRRRNYRSWLTVLESIPGAQPLYDTLPEGICPQLCPVRTQDPDAFIRRFEQRGVDGVHTWPRLRDTVRADPTYDVSAELADTTVGLPVHQHISHEEIEVVGETLSNAF